MIRPARLLLHSALLSALALAPTTLAQAPSILVDCSGAVIPSFGSTPDIVRTSTATIDVALGYQFAFNPNVTGTGLFGGTNQPLGNVLNTLAVGSQRVLFGAVRNPTGTLPTRLDFELVSGSFSGLTLALTLDHQLLADGRGQGAIRNISRPSTLIGLNVVSGGLLVNTWTPPTPRLTEWHFEGDLQSVLQSGLAPSSGPARLRYLDDPAFGPILGGSGALDVYPSTPTPTGRTQAQSSFGTTSSFGLPPINGEIDTVYRTSAPRNPTNPADSALSRGIGLALWPNSRDYWPEDRHGQWTLIWDIYIPQAAWNAAHANSAGGNLCIPLVDDSSNNNSQADVFLRVAGAGAGAASVGYTQTRSSATAAPAIQPNTWFRLAISVDLYGKSQSRIYVNGNFVGTTGANWTYTACKSAAPTYGDISQTNPTGTTVAPATWTAWGQFPSPWAQSPATTGGYMFSTMSLFADLFGAGESIYVANMLYTDQAMNDAQIATLGGPNARGIQFLRPTTPPPCPADFNGTDGLTVSDIFDFLNAWFASSPTANFDMMNGIEVADIFAFLNAWFAGC
ncbi:MAG: hypothetical protein K2W85_12150 [Phycisphaerales bacterium]|nr:hypothetical protein [Phycisphaerales bacterium]